MSKSKSLPVSRKDLIESFVLKYEEEIGLAILNEDEESQKEIGKRARSEIGYKSSMWSMDVFRSINRAYTKIIMSN